MTFLDRHYTPTDITAAKPPVVTIVDHGLQNGQRLRATMFIRTPIASATGMEQLNGEDFVIQQVTANTFELWDEVSGLPVDGRDYTPFVNNGLAKFTLTGPTLPYENIA